MKTRAHARTLIIRTNQNMEVYVFYRSSTTEKAIILMFRYFI